MEGARQLKFKLGGIGWVQLQQGTISLHRLGGIAHGFGRLSEIAVRRCHQWIDRQPALAVTLHFRPIASLGRQLDQSLIGVWSFMIELRAAIQSVEFPGSIPQFAASGGQ